MFTSLLFFIYVFCKESDRILYFQKDLTTYFNSINKCPLSVCSVTQELSRVYYAVVVVVLRKVYRCTYTRRVAKMLNKYHKSGWGRYTLVKINSTQWVSQITVIIVLSGRFKNGLGRVSAEDVYKSENVSNLSTAMRYYMHYMHCTQSHTPKTTIGKRTHHSNRILKTKSSPTKYYNSLPNINVYILYISMCKYAYACLCVCSTYLWF